MRRMSSLPMAAFCGPSADLSQKHGAGRAAALSSAFHARCAKSHDAERLLSRLTEDEREELDTWHTPPDIEVEGALLKYENAEKELTVGLDRFGFFSTDEHCMTLGHLDFAWVKWAEYQKTKTAYVADIKKSRWTTPDGPDSLQLHAYARAYAMLRGCDSYVTGIWAAEDGIWMWSNEVVSLDSERAEAIWDRIFYAATNSGSEFATGPHCSSCYARLHCPEYAVPAHTADTWLTPATDWEKLAQLSAHERGNLLMKLKSLLAIGEATVKQINEAALRGLEFEVNGKRWAAKEMPGRKSLDKEALKAAVGDLGQFEKVGKPYQQFGWIRQ